MAGLTIHRHLPAPPQRVWTAWTDASQFAAWLWPPTFQTRATMQPRPGGRYRVESPVAEIAISGDYLLVDEPHRLAFTWRWDGEEEQTRVTVTLAEAGDGTDLTLDHDGFTAEDARANHIDGWRDCLDRLPGHLARPD